MKVAALISRILLGLVFLIFGLNGFLHFIPQQPMPALAGQYVGALSASHFMVLVFLLQIAGGILLLLNRFVPLGLVLLAPVIVNIFFFHALMAPSGLGLAVVLVVLWTIVALYHKQYFASLFAQRTPNEYRSNT